MIPCIFRFFLISDTFFVSVISSRVNSVLNSDSNSSNKIYELKESQLGIVSGLELSVISSIGDIHYFCNNTI